MLKTHKGFFMVIEDVVDKKAAPIVYTQFERNAIDYRYHDTGKGFFD